MQVRAIDLEFGQRIRYPQQQPAIVLSAEVLGDFFVTIKLLGLGGEFYITRKPDEMLETIEPNVFVSAHETDMRERCGGCGAQWFRDKRGAKSYTMKHRQPCPYLEAQDYGAEIELSEV